MEVMVKIELYDMQSSSQIITTNKPTANYLQAVGPSGHPTKSVKARKGKGIKRKWHSKRQILWTTS